MTDSHLWAGIDVGKEHHWICVLDASGEVVLSRRFANDEKEIISVITDTESLGDSVSWTVDLTTVYATLLLTVLTKAGTPVRYLSGRSVWQASTVYRGGEAKTDARDARVIADQSRMRSDLPVLHPDDELIRELQMLTGHRADLVADRTRTINRLRQQLVAVCPGLERVAQISSDRGGWVVLLTRYQRPKAIRRAGAARLATMLAGSGVRNAESIAQAAVAAAKAQTVRLPPGEDIAAELVAELAQGVIDLDVRVRAADAAIEARFRRHPLAEAIVSLPGIGSVSAPNFSRLSVIRR